MSKIFPNSKVQYTLYHYTHAADEIRKHGFKTAAELGGEHFTNNLDGVFFTQADTCYWNDPTMQRIAVKVNMQNPMDLSFYTDDSREYTPEQRALLTQLEQIKETAEANHDKIMAGGYSQRVLAMETTRALRAAGYDGVIFRGDDNHTEHVVFDTKNIHIIRDKAATFQRATAKLSAPQKPIVKDLER